MTEFKQRLHLDDDVVVELINCLGNEQLQDTFAIGIQNVNKLKQDLADPAALLQDLETSLAELKAPKFVSKMIPADKMASLVSGCRPMLTRLMLLSLKPMLEDTTPKIKWQDLLAAFELVWELMQENGMDRWAAMILKYQNMRKVHTDREEYAVVCGCR